MLTIFSLQSTLRNSLICTLITIPTSLKPLIQKRFFLQFQTPKRFETLRTQMSSSPSNPTQVAADYAKTGRSSCKKCSEPIAKQALRLALITKDARGWDATKWHHFDCFSFGPKSVSSVEEIKGFEDLKSSDQEAVKKLFSEVEESKEEAPEVDEDKNEVGKKNLNNAKILAVAADYAKSSRSSCKKCSEPIAKNALRLALITKDVRGWDATKWHHLDCFSFGSGSVASVENIKGFEDLKSSDQEAVKKLFSEVEKSLEEDSNGKQSSQKRKVPEVDEDENEVGEKDSKKAKVSKMDISFSVSDVKDKYKEATLPPKWKAFQTIIFLERDIGLHDSSKIAAFDFDGCLANTSVKRVGADAWSLMYPSIPDKLQSLYKDGYKLVIFTNEANIERWKNKRQAAVDSKIGRLNNFIKEVKVPIQVFIACGNSQGEDPFRKPKPGMWHILEQHFNSGITIDKNQSFYVGDAAGRSNDHSDADIKFAKANGLKFYVPEEFFDD